MGSGSSFAVAIPLSASFIVAMISSGMSGAAFAFFTITLYFYFLYYSAIGGTLLILELEASLLQLGGVTVPDLGEYLPSFMSG